MIARRDSARVSFSLRLRSRPRVLAGCGIEAKDETSKEHSQIQAANFHIGGVRIRNAFIASLPTAATTAAAGAHAPTSS